MVDTCDGATEGVEASEGLCVALADVWAELDAASVTNPATVLTTDPTLLITLSRPPNTPPADEDDDGACLRLEVWEGASSFVPEETAWEDEAMACVGLGDSDGDSLFSLESAAFDDDDDALCDVLVVPTFRRSVITEAPLLATADTAPTASLATVPTRSTASFKRSPVVVIDDGAAVIALEGVGVDDDVVDGIVEDMLVAAAMSNPPNNPLFDEAADDVEMTASLAAGSEYDDDDEDIANAVAGETLTIDVVVFEAPRSRTVSTPPRRSPVTFATLLRRIRETADNL